MSALVGALRVVLGANTAQYESGMRRAGRTARSTGQDITRSLAAAQRTAVNAFRGIAAAAGIVSVGAGARAFLRYADASKQLEAQLRLATRESGRFAQAQEDVRRIARETRSGLEETATLYGTFQRNSRELGITQLQAARATETLSKTFSISGATASEASNATRQFVQGLQSGVLRGDEFNSVMEQAPRLQRLLAQAMDIPIGRLRAMAEAGRITADQLTKALTDQRFTAGIDEEFRELPVTFDQAMTLVNNAAIDVFGAFDRGGAFSESIANFFQQGADGFDGMADDAEQAGASIRATFSALGDVFDPMVGGAEGAFTSILSMADRVRQNISMLMHEFQTLQNNYVNVANAVDNFGNRVLNPIVRGANPYYPGEPFAPGTRQRSTFADDFDTRQRAARESLQLGIRTRALGGSTRGGRNFGPQEFQRFINEPNRYDLFGNRIGGEPRPPRGAADPAAARRAAAAARRAAAAARREESRRRDLAREEQAFENELASLNTDLLAARQAMVTAAEAIAQLEIQQIEAERDAQNEQYRHVASISDTDRELARRRAEQLVEANNAVAAEAILTVRLREQERIAQEQVEIASSALDDAMDLAQIEGSLAETSEARRASALRLLDLQQEQERLALEAVIASRDATDAERQIAEARLDILSTLYQGRRQSALQDTMGPLDRFVNEIPNTAGEINEAFEAVAANGLQSITDGLADAITMTRSWGDVFKNVASQIISDLLRIQIQRSITVPLANALGSLFGGSGGGFDPTSIVAAFASKSGRLPGFASGGSFAVAGMPGVDRNMLSLNGTPIARVSRGEMVGVGRGGGQRIQIIPSPYFDVVVDGRVIGTGSPMVAAGMSQARTGAMIDMHRSASRRIP